MQMSSSVSIPQHVGLILDGNRRWAKQRGLPSLKGHQAGYKTLKEFIDILYSSGVKYVTAYVFSTENWQRDKEEVSYLMDLALQVFKKDIKEVHKKGIRVRWFGSTEKLSKKHLEAIDKAKELTKNNTKGQLCLCFNYGGQQEIVEAAKKMVNAGLSGDEINEDTFAQNIYEPDIPPIDIIVRSSGEKRLSNFMLWRAAYSELLFIDKHWPDFSQEEANLILETYNARQRRFGT